MNARDFHKLARLIFNSTWGVQGLEYSIRRTSDWRSKDARRAAEFILARYDVTEKKAPAKAAD